ncbi:MAG: transposase [Clostridia bacterium]|nr:transposase [Clostridia bacterium]
MISYKYKLYRTDRTKHLDRMLREACFVWNHALALQKRYYRLYHKYIGIGKMKAHFAKRVHRNLLHSQTTQEILERLDTAYQRFFIRLAKRPPKFRKAKDFSSFLFKQGGYSLNGNVLTINSIKKRFKFSLSRPYAGKVKTLTIKRNHLGEFFIIMVLDIPTQSIGKTHNGASVGIDFGLKKYMTMSDGTTVDNPQFLKSGLRQLQRKSRNLSKCVPGSHNRERKRLELDRHYEKVVNQRSDWQWKLAHRLCQQYDRIFIEDLQLTSMSARWGRKTADLAHGEFVLKLQYIASKYGVTVHKIDRYYPSSKRCTCGYVNHGLQLHERTWVCPECGTVHKRDLLAANNILRQGIVELESVHKTSSSNRKKVQTRSYPRISFLQG